MRKCWPHPFMVFIGAMVIIAIGLSLPSSKITVSPVVHAQTSFNNCENTRNRQVAIGSTSGTNATQIVAAVAGEPIYVCSLVVVGTSGTNPTFSLEQGTGSNCASNAKVILAAFATTANTPVIFPADLTTETASGYALCYLDGGTSPIQWYVITYAQG
jgi:hypothetical protein